MQDGSYVAELVACHESGACTDVTPEQRQLGLWQRESMMWARAAKQCAAASLHGKPSLKEVMFSPPWTTIDTGEGKSRSGKGSDEAEACTAFEIGGEQFNDALKLLAITAAGGKLCPALGPRAEAVLGPVFQLFPTWVWQREARAGEATSGGNCCFFPASQKHLQNETHSVVASLIAVRGLAPGDARRLLSSRLLLSTSVAVQAEVERMLRILQGTSGGKQGPASGGAWYTAVHLRSFDGLCTPFTDAFGGGGSSVT